MANTEIFFPKEPTVTPSTFATGLPFESQENRTGISPTTMLHCTFVESCRNEGSSPKEKCRIFGRTGKKREYQSTVDMEDGEAAHRTRRVERSARVSSRMLSLDRVDVQLADSLIGFYDRYAVIVVDGMVVQRPNDVDRKVTLADYARHRDHIIGIDRVVTEL